MIGNTTERSAGLRDGDDPSGCIECGERIELLLIDLIMPKMNGKEAFDEIRKICPGIKVIFCSGYAPDTIRDKMSLEDCIHQIAKPIVPNDLLRNVRNVLDGK